MLRMNTLKLNSKKVLSITVCKKIRNKFNIFFKKLQSTEIPRVTVVHYPQNFKIHKAKNPCKILEENP